MYHALTDPVIQERQKEVYESNQRLIELHASLPFWKRWQKKEVLREGIMRNWKTFEKWEMEHVRKMKALDK